MQLASSCARIAPLMLAASLLSQSALADDPKPAPPEAPPPAAAAPPAPTPPAAPAATPPAAPAATPPAAAPPAAPPAAPAPGGGKRDVGLVIGGVIMMAFGAPSLSAGTYLAATCHSSSSGCSQKTDGIVALTLTGTALLAGGIITTIAGLKQTPPDKAAASGVRWVPDVAIGPTGGAVRWVF